MLFFWSTSNLQYRSTNTLGNRAVIKQTISQSNKQTEKKRKTDGQADRLTNKQRNKQTNKRTNKQRNKQRLLLKGSNCKTIPRYSYNSRTAVASPTLYVRHRHCHSKDNTLALADNLIVSSSNYCLFVLNLLQ